MIRVHVTRAAFELRGAAAGALRGVDLVVPSGEVLAVLGEHDAGGSEVAALAGGGARPRDGEVAPASTIALRVPDAGDGALSADELLARAGAAPERRAELLARVGLDLPDGSRAIPSAELRADAQRRIAVAAALAAAPSLLVVEDDGGERTARASLARAAREAVQGTDTGVLVVTADAGLANACADRVGVLYDGRVVEHGPAEAVLNAPQHPHTAELCSAADPEAVVTGAAATPAPAPSGCPYRSRCPRAGSGCDALRPELGPIGAAGQTAACWHPLSTAAPAPPPTI